MEIWYYERKMRQFQNEETTEDAGHYEVLKIIENDSPGAVSDKHEIVAQNLTEKEAKDKVVELTNLLDGN